MRRPEHDMTSYAQPPRGSLASCRSPAPGGPEIRTDRGASPRWRAADESSYRLSRGEPMISSRPGDRPLDRLVRPDSARRAWVDRQLQQPGGRRWLRQHSFTALSRGIRLHLRCAAREIQFFRWNVYRDGPPSASGSPPPAGSPGDERAVSLRSGLTAPASAGRLLESSRGS